MKTLYSSKTRESDARNGIVICPHCSSIYQAEYGDCLTDKCKTQTSYFYICPECGHKYMIATIKFNNK